MVRQRFVLRWEGPGLRKEMNISILSRHGGLMELGIFQWMQGVHYLIFICILSQKTALSKLKGQQENMSFIPETVSGALPGLTILQCRN